MFDMTGNIDWESGKNRYPGKKQSRKTSKNSYYADFFNSPSVLAGLSREVRTKMNEIVAFSFLLTKEDYSEDERQDYCNQIYRSCDGIITMFDNFLDSAIIDSGNSKSRPEICNPEEIFNDLFKEFGNKFKRDQIHDVIIVFENGCIGNTRYIFDSGRITRAIRNLFNVAAENTKSGYIKSGYSIRNNNLIFYIEDSGDGYLKCRELILGNHALDSILKYNDLYTSLNLSLARKIVQLIGGTMKISRNGFSGSRISFCVPVIQAIDYRQDHIDKYSNTMSTF